MDGRGSYVERTGAEWNVVGSHSVRLGIIEWGRSIHWEQWMPLKGFSAHEIDDKHLPSNLESQSRRSRQQRP